MSWELFTGLLTVILSNGAMYYGQHKTHKKELAEIRQKEEEVKRQEKIEREELNASYADNIFKAYKEQMNTFQELNQKQIDGLNAHIRNQDQQIAKLKKDFESMRESYQDRLEEKDGIIAGLEKEKSRLKGKMEELESENTYLKGEVNLGTDNE